MADVIVSKIQHRRGLYRDLPDLDAGELGYTTDTGQLFLGVENQTDNLGVKQPLSVIITKQTTDASNSANFFIANRIKQFDLGFQANPDDALTALEAISGLTVPTDPNVPNQLRLVEFGEEPEPGEEEGHEYEYRGYAGYYKTDTVPFDGLFLDEASKLYFDRGMLELQISQSYEYILADSHGIAELVNLVNYNQRNEEVGSLAEGLVSTNPNIEVLTEFSDLAKLIFPRVPKEVDLTDLENLDPSIPAEDQDPENPIIQLGTFPADVYDAGEVEYTISAYPIDFPENIVYRRKGRLSILIHGNEPTVYDSYLENGDDSLYVIDIIGEFIDDTTTVKVIAKPHNFGTDPAMGMLFKTLTAKWSTFSL